MFLNCFRNNPVDFFACLVDNEEKGGTVMKLKFTVTGMTCAACSARVEKVTRQVPGVNKADVNLLGGSMVVEAADAAVANPIIKAVTAAGYGAALAGKE